MKRFPSIKKNSEFRAVYKSGRSKATGLIVVYIMPNNTDSNRLGVSASRKVGNSVIRHTFARKMREIFRLNNNKTVQGYDIIVTARNRARDADYKSLEKDYMRLLSDHRLLKK